MRASINEKRKPDFKKYPPPSVASPSFLQPHDSEQREDLTNTASCLPGSTSWAHNERLLCRHYGFAEQLLGAWESDEAVRAVVLDFGPNRLSWPALTSTLSYLTERPRRMATISSRTCGRSRAPMSVFWNSAPSLCGRGDQWPGARWCLESVCPSHARLVAARKSRPGLP